MNNDRTFTARELSTRKVIDEYLRGDASSVVGLLQTLERRFRHVNNILIESSLNDPSGGRLGNACGGVSYTFSLMAASIDSICQNIKTEITNYISETIANESGATQSLDEIKENIASIDASLAAI